MAAEYLDFEKPIQRLEEALAEVRRAAERGDEAAKARIEALEKDLEAKKKDIYSKMTPWERVRMARQMTRPRTLDFISAITTEFTELAGDRRFGDDKAVVCGFARFDDQPVAVVGQQKGKDAKENIFRNWGMMNPEGYRKALRTMRLADRFGMPILIFIDTPGAFPGVGAEERGQAEAIAYNIQEMMGLRVPIVLTVVGEGASGGALGIGLADRVLMLENAWYCVISPEGCAAILYKDAAHAPKAADALKLTAKDLLKLKVIDEIVDEPLGGAHRHPDKTFENVAAAIRKNLKQLGKLSVEKLMETRFDKYRNMGEYVEK